MTAESQRPKIIIDTNKHGIRREINLTKLAKKAEKKKKYEANPHWKKKKIEEK